MFSLLLNSNWSEATKSGTNNINAVISGALAVTILILLLGLYYKISLERATTYHKLPKLIFLIFLLIRWIKKTTIELLGRRYNFVIPFFIYIVFYFWGSSFVGMFGFKGISAFAIVPLSVATLVFVGTVLSGIATKGWGFCRDYYVWLKVGKKKLLPIPDVLKILGELGKVISLGLRLWGNYFAGALVLFIVHHFLEDKFQSWSAWGYTVTSLLAFPLHIYFDLVDGALHSMIFLLLTISYWQMAKQIENRDERVKK